MKTQCSQKQINKLIKKKKKKKEKLIRNGILGEVSFSKGKERRLRTYSKQTEQLNIAKGWKKSEGLRYVQAYN